MQDQLVARVDLEVEGGLRLAEDIRVLVVELDAVLLALLDESKPAQVDDEAGIDVGRKVAVCEGVAVDLAVPRSTLRDGDIAVGLWVVDGEGDHVVRVLLLVLHDASLELAKLLPVLVARGVGDGRSIVSAACEETAGCTQPVGLSRRPKEEGEGLRARTRVAFVPRRGRSGRR
jgi:hypothetical protein